MSGIISCYDPGISGALPCQSMIQITTNPWNHLKIPAGRLGRRNSDKKKYASSSPKNDLKSALVKQFNIRAINNLPKQVALITFQANRPPSPEFQKFLNSINSSSDKKKYANSSPKNDLKSALVKQFNIRVINNLPKQVTLITFQANRPPSPEFQKFLNSINSSSDKKKYANSSPKNDLKTATARAFVLWCHNSAGRCVASPSPWRGSGRGLIRKKKYANSSPKNDLKTLPSLSLQIK